MQSIGYWFKHQLADGRWVLVTTGRTYQAVRVFQGSTPTRGDYDALLTHYISAPRKFIKYSHEVTAYASLKTFLVHGVKPRQKP